MLGTLALAGFIGWGTAHQIPTDPVPDGADGLEIRALWGGEHGDRWSAWLGRQAERVTKEGVAFGLPVDRMPAYSYAAVLRRWSRHLDGPVTLFAGTGIGYRDLTTCTTVGPCIPGDAYVSSRWAFAQEAGFRWRVVEVSLGHFSTGSFSLWNKGVNNARFALLWKVGR